ncbi:MAG TPA: hypothetical protein VL069_02950 [Opitutus sp.]|nr:hypothetical protein [Opitutus sp.]
MTRGESQAHAELKRLALTWAQANGFVVCAGEVRVPKSGYRADVAACSRGATRRTAVFECKQARADLLKDAHAELATRLKLSELTERRRTLEAMFTTHCPDLRRGDALWPEYDSWDFSRLEHQAYRAVLAELEILQRRVIRGTKFSRMFRWRCADFLYLVVEEGIFAEAEIPAGWGLLMRVGAELRLVRAPVALEAGEAQRLALLESIALAATRPELRAAGVELPMVGRQFGFGPKLWGPAESSPAHAESLI